jgi:hypothetical protein
MVFTGSHFFLEGSELPFTNDVFGEGKQQLADPEWIGCPRWCCYYILNIVTSESAALLHHLFQCPWGQI